MTPEQKEKQRIQLIAEHLPPAPLLYTVLVCSGILWMLAFRDLFATGKPILGAMDDAIQHFTKSNQFFDDSRGWKSKAGGLSTIESVTTDANNMGGLFIRKLCGVAALTVHSQKLIPLLFHPRDAQWRLGHFNPMLGIAILGNVAIALLHFYYMADFSASSAEALPKLMIGILSFEAFVMLCYYMSARRRASKVSRTTFTALPEGKTPSSITNRIVMRTVLIVSTLIAIICGRDLFFPGQILPLLPRDDIYLEWTNAFLHSPPPDSPESKEHGLESPLYIGDLYVSQYMALCLLIACLYKFATALFIRYGQNRSGEIKCQVIWKVMAIGDGLMVFILRLFAPAAKSASLDLRWHLMCVAYEAFILGVHAFFS